MRYLSVFIFPTFLSSLVFGQLKEIVLADPTIFLDKGTYYLYGTGDPDGFSVYSSKDLKTWRKQSKKALSKGESYGSTEFWAPQVIKYKERYFMAYTADEHIAIASSNSPLGPFRQTTLHPIAENGKQIDPFIFKDDNGDLYLYHVRLKEGNRIFVSRLNENLDAIDEKTTTQCIQAEQSWENTANAKWPVSEGPTVIKQHGLYYLLYSANDFRNIDYAVGYAVASSPVGPWTKYAQNPIISRTNTGKNGSGHGDIIKTKNGELYYVFHTHYSNEKVGRRLSAIIKIAFLEYETWGLRVDSLSFRYLESTENSTNK